MKKENRLKSMLKAWLLLIGTLIYIVVIGLLFKTHHYIAGTFLIVLFVIFLAEYNMREIRKNIYEELLWMNECLVNPEELKNIQEQRAFYDFMLAALKTEQIKKGMPCEDIYKFLEEQDKNNTFSFRPYLYFGNSDKEKNRIIKLYGFGYGVPTPKLILEIKNKKLFDWYKG